MGIRRRSEAQCTTKGAVVLLFVFIQMLPPPMVVESVAVYASSISMLVQSSVKEFISLRPQSRGKRRGSIYFLSSKALRQSRMTRGGRSALKSSEPSQADVQRVLRFKLPNSTTEEEEPDDDVQGNEDTQAEDVSSGHGEQIMDVLPVSNDSIF